MQTVFFKDRICFLPVFLLAAGTVFGQASLKPPTNAFDEATGEPVAFMKKTIDQLEPRWPIDMLPFEVMNEGAYYLINSLQGLETNHGIIIKANNVEIDLNGFGIFGVTNSYHGITIDPPFGEGHNITIHNGLIGEWGGNGINATNAFDSEVTRVKLFENGGGILLSHRAVIRDCNVDQSDGPGIVVGDGSRVLDCKVFENGMAGIMTGIGAMVNACLSVENSGNGISVGNHSVIKNCLAGNNDTNGILIDGSCVVADNTCSLNGLTNSSGAGICVIGRGNRIENNNLTINYVGIELSEGANRVENNTLSDNSYGIKNSLGGNLIVKNSVSGGPGKTNFVWTAPCSSAQILTNPPPNFIATNAWANFEL